MGRQHAAVTGGPFTGDGVRAVLPPGDLSAALLGRLHGKAGSTARGVVALAEAAVLDAGAPGGYAIEAADLPG